jgi:hypothetical protein
MPRDLGKEHRTHHFFPMGVGIVKAMGGVGSGWDRLK